MRILYLQPIPSPKLLTPQSNHHWKHGEDLQGYPFQPLGEAPWSLRHNLPYPNFATFSHSAQT